MRPGILLVVAFLNGILNNGAKRRCSNIRPFREIRLAAVPRPKGLRPRARV